MAALTQRSSPDGPLRASFVENKAAFEEKFFETVEAYVELTEKQEREVLTFLAEAARTWLVFGTQRFRIRMVLPGSAESNPKQKMKLAQEQENLEFTVTPKLQKHGNAKGGQFEETIVLSGCNGKVDTIRRV